MEDNKVITCPLCAHRFTTADLASCQFCADKGKCVLMCCPRCGYSFPQRRDVGEKKSLWRKLRPKRLGRGAQE